MVHGKRLALTRSLHYLDLTDRAMLLYLGGVLLAVLACGRDLPVFWEVIVVHIVLMCAIVMLAVHGSLARKGWATFAHDWYPVLLFTYLYPQSGKLRKLFFSRPFDRQVLVLDDAIFGYRPDQTLPKLVAKHQWLVEVLHLCYFSYYLYLPVVGGVLYVRDRVAFRRMIFSATVMFLVSYALYFIFPVLGPVEGRGLLFEGFFDSLVELAYRMDTPGGAIPSSHIAVGLIAFLEAWRHNKFFGMAVAPFVIGLILATVSCGFHFGTDALSGIALFVVITPVSDWLWGKFGGVSSDRTAG